MEDIAELRRRIYAKQTVFAEVMKEYGKQTLYDYVQRLYDWSGDALIERRKGAITVISNIVGQRLGQKLAEEVRTQLTSFPIISTTDHHSWLQDPFWLNADLLQALGIQSSGQPDLKHVVVLSFSSISLNNKDGYPKGTVHHVQSNSALVHVPLFSDKDKQQTVYAAPGLKAHHLQHWLHSVHQYTAANTFAPHEAEVLEQVVLGAYDETLFKENSLATQITQFNSKMWRTLFQSSQQPELIYVEIETVVTNILIEYLADKNSLLYALFFDSTMHTAAVKEFVELRGGFNTQTKSGSYFFWAINDHFHREAVFLHNGTLEDEKYTTHISWDAASIAAALAQKKLMPGMLLCYLIISLYYGFKCFGGFCQVQDLLAIKKAWQRVLASIGEHEEETRVEGVITNAFLGDVALVQYHGLPATSWDMIASGEKKSFAVYAQHAAAVTLENAIEPMLPAMYKVVQ